MEPERFPVKISEWSSSSKVKRGRKKYPKVVVMFPQAMRKVIADLIGKRAEAYRDGNKVIIEVIEEGANVGGES